MLSGLIKTGMSLELSALNIILFFYLGSLTVKQIHVISELVSKKVKVKVTQWCPTLCNSMDCNPPGFSVCGILQARIL